MTRRGFHQVTRAREDAILATRAALEEAKATLARERRRTEAFDASRRTLEAMKAAVAADARENEHPPPTRYVPSSA
jgi:DNA-binding GntR family transcriptional regulator